MNKTALSLALLLACGSAFATGNHGGNNSCGGSHSINGCGGATGPTGPQGPQGPAGKDGRDGKDGRNGVDGKDGKNGINGRDGKDGATGAIGAAGPAGSDGAIGATGPQGIQGENAPDAVTVQQMTDTVAASSAQTSAQVRDLRNEIHGVAKAAYSGVAAAMALQMPALNPTKPEALTMRLGVGAYKGQGAVGISFRKGNKAGDWSVSGGVAHTGQGVGVALGLEHSF